MIPEVLSDEKRTIYSDVDVLCNGSILPLWEIDLGEDIAAMVSEGPAGDYKRTLLGLDGSSPYFYAGLMLMDLERMRAESCAKKFFECTAANISRLSWPDQDVINIVLNGRIMQLDDRWDGINVRYSPFRRDIAIWHFPGVVLYYRRIAYPAYEERMIRCLYENNPLCRSGKRGRTQAVV